MSEIGCLGVCIYDPETGVCLACGRVPDGVEVAPPPQPLPPAAEKAPLPPQVADLVGDSSE